MASIIVVGDIVWDGTASRGGHTMHVFSWLQGLAGLGHRVLFVDVTGVDRTILECETVPRLQSLMSPWWTRHCTGLMCAESGEPVWGVSAAQLRAFAAEADALITLGIPGARELPRTLTEVRPRILIETDPGYTHMWAAQKGAQVIFGEHDFYFTVGTNVGTPRCKVPTAGVEWLPTWNPALLDWWQNVSPAVCGPFTTVADWWSKGWIEFEGQVWGPKAEEFKKFLPVPELTHERIELALNIDADNPDIAALQSHGWDIKDPAVVATPASYRAFILHSGGEFTCAKGGYVGTHCGWFSDRSACYLAAGRPVITQATGFEDTLPTGEGLFAVRDVEEAAAAVWEVRRDYARHSAAAQALAAEHFDSRRVISQILSTAAVDS